MSQSSQIREEQWGAKAIVDQGLQALIAAPELANGGVAAMPRPPVWTRSGREPAVAVVSKHQHGIRLRVGLRVERVGDVARVGLTVMAILRGCRGRHRDGEDGCQS